MRNLLTGLLLAASFSTVVSADSEPDDALTLDTVLVEQGDVKFTLRDFDAASKRIPARARAGYMADLSRVVQDITALLALEVVASRARKENYLERDDIQAILKIEENKVLANRYVEDWLASQPPADFEQIAKEQYLANQDKYLSPERVDVRHILIATAQRSDAEARKIANEVLKKAKRADAEAFAKLVTEYSDDRGSKDQGGLYEGAARTSLVKPFADAAFEAKKLNKAFGPVQSSFGYHVMMVHKRYEARPLTMEEVVPTLIPGIEANHVSQQRRDYLNEVKAADKTVNEEAILGLREFYAGDLLEAMRDFNAQKED